MPVCLPLCPAPPGPDGTAPKMNEPIRIREARPEDLEEVTRAQLAYGQSLMRLLRQERSRPSRRGEVPKACTSSVMSFSKSMARL